MDIPALFSNPSLTINDVTRQYPQSLSVFNKHSIDFCCGGKKNFFKACEDAKVDAFSLIEEISVAKVSPGELRFKNWSPVFLANYIVENHHSFVREAIPELHALLDKVVSRHGDTEPVLIRIRENFAALADELLPHLEKEEQVLFPAIAELFGNEEEKGVIANNINLPIAAMEDEHEQAGKLIKLIRELSNNYVAPPYACPTFQLMYQKLDEFDKDLMQHIYLENSVLFNKCLVGQEALNH